MVLLLLVLGSLWAYTSSKRRLENAGDDGLGMLFPSSSTPSTQSTTCHRLLLLKVHRGGLKKAAPLISQSERTSHFLTTGMEVWLTASSKLPWCFMHLVPKVVFPLENKCSPIQSKEGAKGSKGEKP